MRRDCRKGQKVLVVHRPRYDDWSLPKGKAEPGESDEACALREVEEETGLRCTLGEQLAPLDYIDGRGRTKRVSYFVMEPIDGEFVINDEVDEVRWVLVHKAHELLTYPRDAEVLSSLSGPSRS